jgi:hypothetical protein
MVLDNVAYHHSKKITGWLRKNVKLELFFLPPYSPDLNAIERAWWYMRKKITHNRYVKTLKERKVQFWKMFSHFLVPNPELNLFVKFCYYCCRLTHIYLQLGPLAQPQLKVFYNLLLNAALKVCRSFVALVTSFNCPYVRTVVNFS